MERGLSLAAVVRSDFSRAYLNQIELGRAQPSTRILAILAERLDLPIEYFLEEPQDSSVSVELRLAEAATRLRQNDPNRARELMTELMAQRKIGPDIRLRAELLLADALLKLRSLPDAVAVLERARAAAERGGMLALQVEIYDRMGRAQYQLRRPHEAGRWWDRALNLYEESGLSDPLLKARILGHRANLHYVAGQPREAIAGYQAAITAAEHMLDMEALGGIYEGLAVSFKKTGDLSRALEYAQRSLRVFDTLHDIRMSAQLKNNMAEILMSQQRHEAAGTLFNEGAEQLRQVGDRDLLPHLLAGAAEAALEQGDRVTAGARVVLALSAADASADPLAKLAAERIAGKVSSSAGRFDESRAHFERAIAIAEAIGSATDKSRAAFDYAQALEEQGDSVEALVRYRQAYRAKQAAGIA